MDGIKGWLVVYLIGSVPVQLYYAAGLAGWFFDYPLGLLTAIGLVLAVPLLLVVIKVPSAPAWNIAGLWVGGGLITVRVLYGVVFADLDRVTGPAVAILAGTVIFAIAWATVWTTYFRTSRRVAQTFHR